VEKLYGPSFLPAFGANRPKLYASTNAMSQAIVSGEIDLGITNSFGVIQMADTGAPIAGVIPKNTVLFGGNIADFSKAPRPNGARLFCDFACSAEGQTLINVAGATIPDASGCQGAQGRLARAVQQDDLVQPAGLQEDHRRHAAAASGVGQARPVTPAAVRSLEWDRMIPTLIASPYSWCSIRSWWSRCAALQGGLAAR
jgi:ABC-type Fe3+ transport system substrate-binding protein